MTEQMGGRDQGPPPWLGWLIAAVVTGAVGLLVACAVLIAPL